MRIIIVENDLCDIRIDKYLIDKLETTRSKIQKLIESGNVLVNDKSIKNSYIVRVDDEIKVNEVEESCDINPVKMDLDIVYEDDYLLVVNKPSGMVVHPANGHYNDTLVNGLMYHTNLSSGDVRPGIVHRIDKDTSGLLLVAKNDDVHLYLSNELKKQKVNRKYIALVYGVINEDTATIDAPIGRDPNNRQKMCVTDKCSKEAITNFKVLKRFEKNTLVECKLDTGRTHQIRVHFNYIGYPVHGDPVYGRKSSVDSFGQYLHSKTIRFVHPITKEELFFDSPLPPEFVKKLESLEQ